MLTTPSKFSRRGTCGENWGGTCGENWGESTTSETREMGVCSERATPAPPPPEGEGEEGARPPAPDECLEALPPLSLDQGRAGGEGAPQTQHQVHPETPPASPAHLKGGKKKKKKKSQGAKLPKKFSRGEKSAEQGEQSLKGVSVLYKIFSWKIVPTAQQTSQHKSHKSSPWCIFSPYT